MTLTPEDRQAIIDYRIERSHATMKEVEFIVTGKFWNLAANRLYYSVFYICEALLLRHPPKQMWVVSQLRYMAQSLM